MIPMKISGVIINRSEMSDFRNTRFNSCVEPVTGKETRKIIKHLRHARAPGHDQVTVSKIVQLLSNCDICGLVIKSWQLFFPRIQMMIPQNKNVR